MRRGFGFSLIESLLALALTLAVVLGALEFFGFGRVFFSRMKDRSEERRAALTALDKVEDDLDRAGRSLAVPIGKGLVEGLAAGVGRLTIVASERELHPAADIQPGQTRVAVADAEEIMPGRELVLYDGDNAQIFSIVSFKSGELLLTPEAGALYRKEESRLLLLYRVEYFLDPSAGIVRRRENGGSGQPLLELVAGWESAYDRDRNIAAVRLSRSTPRGEIHDITVFPKNLAPSFSR
ncbi:MAG: hypothetical protein JW747_00670 [Candidatus Aminicenantes bacterium]|nr:hypothetical protein [Candidatus Aminicenantes bacterium]